MLRNLLRMCSVGSLVVFVVAIAGCSKDDSTKGTGSKADKSAKVGAIDATATIEWKAEIPTVRISSAGHSIAGNQLDSLVAADAKRREATMVRIPTELYAALQEIRKVIDTAKAAGTFAEAELGKIVIRPDSDVEAANVFDVVGAAFRVGFRSIQLAGPNGNTDAPWLHLASTKDSMREYEMITVLITTEDVWVGAQIMSETVKIVREDGAFDGEQVVSVVTKLVDRIAKSSYPLELELSADADVASGDLVTMARLLGPIGAKHPLVFVLPNDVSVRFRE